MSVENKIDVAVVGGGIAGLMAAVGAAEQGLTVVLLEQGVEERYPCNTRYTGGAFHIGFHEIHEGEDALLAAINKRTAGGADADLARAVARDARVAVQWLKGKGMKFIKGGADAWRMNTLAPPPMLKPGLHWEGRGGDVMMRTLTGVFAQLGGKLLLGARALSLRMEDGRCMGVEMEQKGERSTIAAKNVVICDGGFQGNLSLLREFITAHPEKLKQRGAGNAHGDGLQMARAIGARIVGMNRFYGHMLCRDAMHNDRLWPYPMLDPICAAAIVVDSAARRFVDEGGGGIYIANCVAQLPDPLTATVVFDEAVWNGPAREHLLPTNPNLVSAGGTIYKAPDLVGLAKKVGLPPEALEAGVSEYNAAVDANKAQLLNPVRTTSAYKAYPICKPPYYAIQLCAGITFTMGGLAIDGTARVLNEQNKPIPGLYAAGCATGGLEGGGYAGYIGGLAKSAVSALLAANHIAARR